MNIDFGTLMNWSGVLNEVIDCAEAGEALSDELRGELTRMHRQIDTLAERGRTASMAAAKGARTRKTGFQKALEARESGASRSIFPPLSREEAEKALVRKGITDPAERAARIAELEARGRVKD